MDVIDSVHAPGIRCITNGCLDRLGGREPGHLGVDDAAVRAAGKLLETTEHARGHQYVFRWVTGRADLPLDAAEAEKLRDAGHTGTAERISRKLIGRDVLSGRWSFQVVDGYYRCFQHVERLVREQLTGGRRHLPKVQIKVHRLTHGHPAHIAGWCESHHENTKE
jgi:hypothetical protein